MSWIEIKSEHDLPPEGKYVIAKHNRGTWYDIDDQKNVNTVVVKLVFGISEEERQKINGDRKYTYKREDQHGNNNVPWAWDTFGPDSFFGQNITHWMPIPPIVNKENV